MYPLPTTLDEFLQSRDWVELIRPDDIPQLWDFVVCTNGEIKKMTQDWRDGLKLTFWQKQHPGNRYFRCTLGTVANPYRPEHFVKGKITNVQTANLSES
jgi:hypothetical protein